MQNNGKPINKYYLQLATQHQKFACNVMNTNKASIKLDFKKIPTKIVMEDHNTFVTEDHNSSKPKALLDRIDLLPIIRLLAMNILLFQQWSLVSDKQLALCYKER